MSQISTETFLVEQKRNRNPARYTTEYHMPPPRTPKKMAGSPSASLGTYKVNLPYKIDEWLDPKGRLRLSVQIWLMSGTDRYQPRLRVSGSLTSIIISFPMCASFLREFAFETGLAQSSQDLKEFHPKLIARTITTNCCGMSKTQTFHDLQFRRHAHSLAPSLAFSGLQHLTLHLGESMLYYHVHSLFDNLPFDDLLLSELRRRICLDHCQEVIL